MSKKHHGDSHHHHHHKAFGHHHHHSGYEFQFGTRADDVLEGTPDRDVIFGRKGNDTIVGNDGNDWLFGGKGKDLLEGGNGNDKLFGDRGADELYGNDGNDWLYGGRGNDLLDGGAGSDKVFGGKGNDVAVFSLENDAVADACGSVVRDFYDGGAGHDILRLMLTVDELARDDVQKDIQDFRDFLEANGGKCGGTGEIFEFESLNLTVRNFEELDVAGNAPPKAHPDHYIVKVGASVVYSPDEGVLANDTDPDGQPAPLTAVLVGDGPEHALEFDLFDDGGFSYTPEPGYFGPDPFTYQAYDGADYSDVTNVMINVQPDEPPPPPPPPAMFDVDGMFA